MPRIGGRIEARVGCRDHTVVGGSAPLQKFYIYDLEKAYFCRLLSAEFNFFLYNQKLSKYIRRKPLPVS